MTFLELAKAVRQECGVQGTGPAAVTSQSGLLLKIVDWTANADLLVQSLHPDWNFLWAEYTSDTSVDSVSLTKPDDFGMWDKESFGVARGVATGRPLSVVSYKEWRSNFSLKTNAAPYSLCIMPDGNLSLSAPADAVYSIYGNYWEDTTLLTANADTPSYPVKYQRVIITRAKMWYFEYVESTTQWEQAKKEYDEVLKKLEGYALPNQQTTTQSSPRQMYVRSL